MCVENRTSFYDVSAFVAEARIVQINRATFFIKSTPDKQAAKVKNMKPGLLPETTPSETGTHPRTWMLAGLYRAVRNPALFARAHVPTHLVLIKLTAARITRQRS